VDEWNAGSEMMKPSLLVTLYNIAKLGAYPGEIAYTTGEIATKLGLSQQTASRHLIELEKLGLIERKRTARGVSVQLAPEGVRQLYAMYLTLQGVFEKPVKEVALEGELFKGLGEGAYYISQPGYRRQFIEKLGFDPYPGTLNLKVGEKHRRERRILEAYPHVLIEGFHNGTRSFGPVKCYRAVIEEKIEGAVITALRSHYGEEVIEIIAPRNLRETLKLRDGDMVRVRVSPFHPIKKS
jgi:riboflavin kinase